MRHRISRCLSMAAVAIAPAATVLGTGSFSAAQTVLRKIHAPPPAPAAAPRPTPQCNSATARRYRPRRTEGSSRLVVPYFFYPVSPRPRYDYRTTYYPRYYPSYYPLEEAEESLTVRVSTYEEQKRAGDLIGRGDESFGRRSYVSAIARYREAIGVAPDLAEARIRVALALIAQRKYSPAATALLEAAQLQTDWHDSPLHLDELYARGELEKTTKVLTRLVESDPMNAQNALVLGAQLFFSGDHEAAQRYFTRAAQLGADKHDRLAAFRPPEEVARAAQ